MGCRTGPSSLWRVASTSRAQNRLVGESHHRPAMVNWWPPWLASDDIVTAQSVQQHWEWLPDQRR